MEKKINPGKNYTTINKEQYELMVRLNKKQTFIDYIEDLLHDISKIDTSGL